MEELKDKILFWIERTVGENAGFFLPLKKLRKDLVDGLTVPIPPLEELIRWLEEDGRFDLLPEPEGLALLPSGPAEEMERLGFFDGPRVGLKAKRPTRADMIERGEEHASRLLGAIQKGYSAGKIDEETFERTANRLIEFLQRARDARESEKSEH